MLFTTSILHPNEFNEVSGETQYCREIDSINQSIRLILLTSTEELFGDPGYGSKLQEYIYHYEGELLYGLLKDEIIRCLSNFEPRIIVRRDDITIDDEYNRTIKINIKYTLRNANAESNIDLLLRQED